VKILAYIFLVAMLSSTAIAQQKLNKEQQRNKKMVRYYAQILKVDADLCDAIAQIESSYKSKAFNNPKKPLQNEVWISRGVMQLTFDTGQKFNRKIQKKDDLYQAEQNIIAGIRYIKYLMNKYPLATLGDITQLYNLGETKFLQGTRNPSYAEKFQAIYWDIKEKQLSNLSLGLGVERARLTSD
jgi:soluble lytic murein transglycosylase-like protein